MLARLLTPALASFLEGIAEPSSYPTPDSLELVLERWQARGARIETLGWSRSGRPIRCAVIGSGERSFLAWGFPHPDEPFGAASLEALGEGLLDGKLSELADWRFQLILCADPDEAGRNAAWLQGPRTAAGFLSFAWRPALTGLEVDYGLPLFSPPFANSDDYLGRCRNQAECRERCGGGACQRRGLAFEPLPESAALALAVDRYRPQVVASMHSAAMGGDYTFLLEREPREVLEDLLALPAACGQPRHLGEPVDRGRHWRRGVPDLLKEQRLQESVRWLKAQPGFDPELLYQDTHSAGNYVEAQGRGDQFICPEVGQFRSTLFEDESPYLQREPAQVSVEERRNGRWLVTRIKIGAEWVIAQQQATQGPLQELVEVLLPSSRAMLGVRALCERRLVLAETDELWRQVAALPGLEPHPYADERFQIQVPGEFVSDGSMRIFRLAERYRRTPTIAQASCFRYRWPLHTATLLSNFQNFLSVQEISRPELAAVKQRLDALQAAELQKLPPELQVDGPIAPALRSQLARVLRIVLAHS